MPAASTSMPSVQVSDFEDSRLLIRHDRLVCDFCSSGQRFACGFLQIPPHDGHPCRPANSSPCRVCRGLAPPSERALPGAQQRTPPASRGVGSSLRWAAHLPKINQDCLSKTGQFVVVQLSTVKKFLNTSLSKF